MIEYNCQTLGFRLDSIVKKKSIITVIRSISQEQCKQKIQRLDETQFNLYYLNKQGITRKYILSNIESMFY